MTAAQDGSAARARRSRRWAIGLIAVGAVAGVAAVAFTTSIVHTTSTPEFCATSCHSMEWAYDSYRRSVHFDNRSGVRATCGDCHVPYESGHPNVIQYVAGTLWTKALAGGSDVFHELLGTISTQAKWEAQRPRLVEQAHAWMKRTDSVTCQGCHDLAAYAGTGNFMAIEEHAGLLQPATVDCIGCHTRNVGHVYAGAAPGTTGSPPAAATAPAAAGSAGGPPSAGGTPVAASSQGVYTAEQASRGVAAYQRACAACHGADLQGGAGPALVGKPFWTDWAGKQVSALWDEVHTQMPLTSPDAMSDQDSLDVLAYMLQRNGLPVGTQELNDTTALARLLPTR